MKVPIKSLRDLAIEKQFSSGNRMISDDPLNRPLIDYLKSTFAVDKIFVIGHIPEQDEEVYTFVVGNTVVFVDQDRKSRDQFKIKKYMSISEFRNHKPLDKRKILDLALSRKFDGII